MIRSVLLFSAALALAAPRAEAGYVLSFATGGVPPVPDITTQLWVADGAVRLGHLDLKFEAGWSVPGPAYQEPYLLRPWNSDVLGFGHQMNNGGIALTLAPDGAVLGGTITDDDGNYHLVMASDHSGDAWGGQVDAGAGRGVQNFVGRWSAAYDATLPASLTEESPGQTFYPGTPVPITLASAAGDPPPADPPGDPPARVPEPGTWALLLTGMAGLAWMQRRAV